jgi:hypothetical protein
MRPSVLWLYWLVLLLWTLFGQNPDNPRHLAPITLLGIVLLAGWLPRRGELPAMLGALLLLLCTLTPPVAPAMTRAARLAEQTCPALVTQWGVRLLRETTTLPVTDGWYRGCRPCAHQGACRLSRRPLGAEALPGPYDTLWFAPAFTPNPASGSPCPAEPGACEGIARLVYTHSRVCQEPVQWKETRAEPGRGYGSRWPCCWPAPC